MLARINKAMAKKDSGFTLIELLVVVIIIGILAAIAIPTFLNQREAGWRAQATANLRQGVTNAETFAVDANGTYVGLTSPALNEGVAGLKNAATPAGDAGQQMEVIGTPTVTTYCIQVTHPSFTGTTGIFSYNKTDDAIVNAACAATP